MKLSKQELLTKIEEKIVDEDLKIELMEDITDSIDEEASEAYKAQYEAEKADLEAQIANEKAYILDLKKKYKERFLTPIDDKEDESIEEVKEEDVIDIKEI